MFEPTIPEKRSTFLAPLTGVIYALSMTKEHIQIIAECLKGAVLVTCLYFLTVAMLSL